MTISISKDAKGVKVSHQFPTEIMESIKEFGERECPMNGHIDVEFNWDFAIKK